MTVRALYHYDAIGLLRASERTASGHRRHTEDDLHRLYRVRALRALRALGALGMSLEEIRDVVTGSVEDLAPMRELLCAQLGELQAEHSRRLAHQIYGLLQQLDESSMPDLDQFMTTLEMISVLDSYSTQE